MNTVHRAARVREVSLTEDLEALTALIRAAYAPLAAQGLRYWATHQTAEDTAKRLSRGIGFVGELDGKPIATITLSGTPPGPITVHMTSSNQALAPVRDRVLWGSSRTLQIPTYPVTQPTLITITASYNGVVKTAVFTIVP